MSKRQLLEAGWHSASTSAGTYADPHWIESEKAVWSEAAVPGTVTQTETETETDSKDWWYRCSFAAPESRASKIRLCFDGLATLADVWLNGKLILNARNMFIPYQCEVDLKDQNALVICFRSLGTALEVRKPRPRWKTSLITQQNLRWVRTTLLGRINTWGPRVPMIGPWRAVFLETGEKVHFENLDLRTEARIVSVSTQAISADRLQSAILRVGSESFPLSISEGKTGHYRISGKIEVPNAPLWWPHTHGEPSLLDCKIELKLDSGPFILDCGRIGFKSVILDRENEKVQFLINGVPVFCRGACWTDGTPESLRIAKQAGLNMIRVCGLAVYESDEFYRTCDELGILVWQDFMFANMDYPVTDPEFRREIENEARHHLSRLQKHVSVTVYCGGTDVQQQAAMMGRPADEWSNDFFDQTLPKLCSELHPKIPYFPSSPCEGALPFHLNKGISHYYGVGAYRRPLKDVKSAGVKFSSECLGFSNVPESESIEQISGGGFLPAHDPRWKRGVPRDAGAGWDFEDVRDHYTRELFGIDPIALRSTNTERYFAVSRVTTGEVVKSVFAEWRKPGSECGGGLIWFFKDLLPGAGWGLVDSFNRPKAILHYLRRAWASQAVLMTDEGADGLSLHILNEKNEPIHAVLGLTAYNFGRVQVAHAEKAIEVTARSGVTVLSDAMLGYFADLTYFYRFGPPKHDVVRAYLKDAKSGELVSEDFYFPSGLNLLRQDPEQVQVTAVLDGDRVVMTLKSRCFLQAVHISSKGYQGSEDYFHLAPQEEKKIYFTSTSKPQVSFKAAVSALNLLDSLVVRVSS